MSGAGLSIEWLQIRQALDWMTADWVVEINGAMCFPLVTQRQTASVGEVTKRTVVVVIACKKRLLLKQERSNEALKIYKEKNKLCKRLI